MAVRAATIGVLAGTALLLGGGALTAQRSTAPLDPVVRPVAVRGDDAIAPRSVALLKVGETQLAAQSYADARLSFEAALAADPRNRAAFIGLARVAIGQGLYGSAIRLTKRALYLEPSDRRALLAQGEAYAALGAVPRAREVEALLKRVCPSGCPEQGALAAAITRGAQRPAAKAAS